ncbi:transcriptional regulator [Caenispirillum salinarum]|uniref:transcriptional regulator n=1 Tax=Caenispirillum salinarum TaxID=859058 RepID=UPI00384EC16A
MQITAAQSRAARALLGWTQADLAGKAAVNKRTVMDFESGSRDPHSGTKALLLGAFEAAGVVFLPSGDYSGTGGPGVRLKAEPPEPVEVASSPCLGDFGET